jgi:hypothetical protein
MFIKMALKTRNIKILIFISIIGLILIASSSYGIYYVSTDETNNNSIIKYIGLSFSALIGLLMLFYVMYIIIISQ